MTARPIQEPPDYLDGFYDAVDGEPLFDGEAPEYVAGWRAWWEVHAIINDPKFLDRPEAAKLPASPDYPHGSGELNS